MKARIKKVFWKTIKIIGITIASLILILFLLPYIMPGTVGQKVKGLVNKSINGELNFTSARLTFFKHFPALTLTLDDFVLKGSKPFESDTLLNAHEVSFGINLPALIRGDIHVDQFFITKGNIHVYVNEQGEANYNVYKSVAADTTATTTSSGDTTATLKIERIVIANSSLIYDDLSSDILIRGKGLNYVGNGDLSKAVFDLKSNLKVDAFDFYYANEPYILQKKVNAELLTSINTNSLALKFEKNKLFLNKLPVDFIGRFDFLSDGYDMDFRLNSNAAQLEDVFTAIPPQYQTWLENTKIKGKSDITASLIGKYIASTNSMPDLRFAMKIREGFIAYDKAPLPLKNLYLDFESSLPQLNPDSLIVQVDSSYFNVGNGYFSSTVKIKGIETPYLKANIKSELDLESLDRALGISAYDFKGNLSFFLHADGAIAYGQNPYRLREEIILTSIPRFEVRSALRNGYFHDKSLPHPVQEISFDLNTNCPDQDYHHTSFSLENLNAKAINNYIKGFFKLKNAKEFPIESNIQAVVNLSEIRQFYPLDSMEILGSMEVNVNSSGNYQPDRKLFPKTEANIKVVNASIRTKYYPTPIEKVNIDATVRNKQGTMSDLDVDVKPIAFEFEGKPFMIQADLHDFNNLQYNIQSKGEIDLGRIYKVFSQEGLDVKGTIETDLSLKGTQADALARRFSRLSNNGVLKVKDIVIRTDIYPLPFHIDQGVFRFNQDRMHFDRFNARYGQSKITMNGSLFNLFDYMIGEGALQGDFQLKSDYILLDEWMAYNADTSSARPDSMVAGSSGVIIIPSDLDLKLKTDIRRVDYNKLHIDSVIGLTQIKNGELSLEKTGFSVAGAVTTMDAKYRSLSPTRAYFSYHVDMKDFDVQRMYNEVELFRDLAPSAASAAGIISLNYTLEGKLNSDMFPVMPSLKGGGVLSIRQVKMKGFRLFSAMGKQTGKEEIVDPDLSKIDFKTKIQNNVVTLERTKMKVSGFRIRMQGQTSLDGQLKLKCRLGLPPFGIIGIPMNITGTGQNPRIKVGKGDELPLEEQKEEEGDDNSL